MTVSSDKHRPAPRTTRRGGGWRRSSLVELIIGLGLATLLVIVGWASSNAIRFVYGGY